MLASASLGEDATLLDLLVEAAQGAFERLVLSHSDFSQSVFTSYGQGLVTCASGARPAGLDACSNGRAVRAAGVYPRVSSGSNVRKSLSEREDPIRVDDRDDRPEADDERGAAHIASSGAIRFETSPRHSCEPVRAQHLRHVARWGDGAMGAAIRTADVTASG